VLVILGILAAVVLVNVVGLTGRGEAESYATDEKTIQTAVSTFYADIHAYDRVNGWNEAAGNQTSFHTYPTASGRYYYKDESDEFSLHLGREDTVNGYNVRVVMRQDKDGSPPRDATTVDVAAAAIWMGLLANGPGEGTGISPVLDDTMDNSAPLRGEYGPYLNPLPKSCSQNNSSAGSGTMTWVVGEYGRVYGVFEDGGVWYAGFGGRYP
jgi:type II secretory pathway pseudopilin PulG